MRQHFRLNERNVNNQRQRNIMALQSKTQIYLKVKKPLLERQRRARINNSLEALKQLIAVLQGDDAVVRMDKAELLEETLVFLKQQQTRRSNSKALHRIQVPTDAYRHGYMNAVNEVSRVMASTPGMSVELGKSVMKHLGRNYNGLQQQQTQRQQLQQRQVPLQQHSECTHMPALSFECQPLSPASSGYHSDCESPAASPVASLAHSVSGSIWRPW